MAKSKNKKKTEAEPEVETTEDQSPSNSVPVVNQAEGSTRMRAKDPSVRSLVVSDRTSTVTIQESGKKDRTETRMTSLGGSYRVGPGGFVTVLTRHVEAAKNADFKVIKNADPWAEFDNAGKFDWEKFDADQAEKAEAAAAEAEAAAVDTTETDSSGEDAPGDDLT